MYNNIMNPQDAPLSKHAECFITKGTQRFNMFSATKFEADADIETADVKALGRIINGHKITGMDLAFSMTIYKVTSLFVDMVMEFKRTGFFPTIDIQVTSSDPTTSIGTDTKIYTGCTLDGEVLLSMFDADGDFIEQEISGYCADVESASDYTNPAGM